MLNNTHQATHTPRDITLIIIVLILLSLNFAMLGIDSLNKATNPEYADTTAFLGEANFIKSNGGIANFLNLSLSGKYKQANQHPLYILLLTPFATKDISFFINAKIASLIIGFILVISLFYVTNKLYGPFCAMVASLGVLLNSLFLRWTTLVACESLLMVLSLFCIFFIVRGFTNNKFWIYAGIFAGLAYLTKGSALFLLPPFALASLFVYGTGILKNKYFWLFFILFISVSSPLIIRNVVVYNHPLYNVNLRSYLSDSKIQYIYFNPNEGVALPKIDGKGENDAQLEPSHPRSLNLSDFPAKFARAMLTEGEVLLRSINIEPAASYLSRNQQVVFMSLLFLLFIAGIATEKRLGPRVYIITTVLVFVISLGLFRPIARYFLPIIPFIWIYIALGMVIDYDISNN